MQETYPSQNPKRPRTPEEMARRRARAAYRAKMRRRKRRQQIIVLTILAAVLALIIFWVGSLITGMLNHQGETTPPTVEATVPPTTEPEPTLPPVTWMTFEEGRTLTAAQYLVYDVNGGFFQTISGDLTETIYPASVTKLFTAYVALQYLEPTTVITAGDALELVAAGSSVAEIQRGDKISVEMLVQAMLLPSGNDAACILAVEAGRLMANDSSLSPRAAADLFVAEMNSQAQELGMTGSHFANPDGIHRDSHYTTPADLAILGKLSLENPTILKYAQVAYENVTLASGSQMQWKNTNATINPNSEFYCPYAIGLKTGSTPRAGSCLLSAFECDGRTLIVGVFGCASDEDRFMDTLHLFNEAMGFTSTQ